MTHFIHNSRTSAFGFCLPLHATHRTDQDLQHGTLIPDPPSWTRLEQKKPTRTNIYLRAKCVAILQLLFYPLLFVIITFISFFQPTINNYGDDNDDDGNAVGW